MRGLHAARTLVLGLVTLTALTAPGARADGGAAVRAGLLAEGGTTAYRIVLAPDAIAPERYAAEELARFLGESTGATFAIVTAGEEGPGPRILVGQGDLVRELLPNHDLAALGADGLVERTVGGDLILTGGRPRGTLYAVYDFLEDVVGCRWWSSKVSTIPRHDRLALPRLDVTETPVLEYREPFWFDAFDGDWAARNRANGNSERLDEAHGGKHVYKGFVHTFFPLVPPSEHFATHPEWYSEIDGQRSAGGQLCLTNEELVAFTLEQVKAWLRESPEATIVSVSQNDWWGACQCEECAALEKEEGSPIGPILHFVNRIAAGIEDEFPHVAVDTLAYSYSRKPPLHVKPRPNVIVRLCSIECDFSRPLTAEVNKTFADDIRGWSKKCQRLYIWDYTTNFAHYLLPHPNLRALGPNVRFFAEHGAKGIFEQGAYQSYGAEFAELRAWLLAKLLWDPYQDDEALIDEFLRGYYGEAAGPIGEYIDLMADTCEAADHYLSCYSSNAAPFLSLETLTKAEALFDRAEAAVADDPAVLDRVRMARVPIRYVWFSRYFELQQRAKLSGIPWAGPADYGTGVQAFIDFLRAHDVTMVSEGTTLDAWAQRVAALPRTASGPPPGCENLPETDWLDLQDMAFSLYREGDLATRTPDPKASDGVAAKMPGSTREWAVQDPLFAAGADPDAKWMCHVVVRCDLKGTQGTAFSCGLYDTVSKQGVAGLNVPASQVDSGEYRVYQIGETTLRDGLYLWIAPDANPDNVDSVWVDRFFLTRVR